MIKKKLITAKELAVYISVTRDAVYQMLFKKMIPGDAIVRFGHNVRFDLQKIDNWIEDNRDNSPD